MTMYARDEMITATNMVREFSSILKSITKKEKKRAVIIKNNTPEAVLISIEEYERLQEALSLLKEHYMKEKR